MNIIEIVIIALALSVDSFVVATSLSLQERMTRKSGIMMALVFAVCQSVLPLVGAMLGEVVERAIEPYHKWVSFAILTWVGIRMMIEGIRQKQEQSGRCIGGGSEMGGRCIGVGREVVRYLLLGIATSIDSLAVGVSMGLSMQIREFFIAVGVIGAVTFILSFLGHILGTQRLPISKKYTSIAAGIVLIGIGLKILLT